MKFSRSSPLMRAPLMALCVLVLVAVSGCQLDLPAPAPPATPLTKKEVKSLAKCQGTIAKEANALSATTSQQLHGCAAHLLRTQLAFESELITPERRAANLAKSAKKCGKAVAKIGQASTQFADNIIDSCDPVASFIADDYDGLSFQQNGALSAVGGRALAPETPAESLVFTICGEVTLFVDIQTSFSMPRTLELLRLLGEDTVYVPLDDLGEPREGVGIPNIPLDPRCPTVEMLGDGLGEFVEFAAP